MKHKFGICIFLLVLIFSCSTIEQKPKDVKTIFLKKTKDVQPFSSFISELDYIELQAQEHNLVIRKIEKVKLLGDDIIIEHSFRRKSELLRFSGDGKLLNKIGKIGEQQGEINEPRDVIRHNDNYAVWDKTAVHSISKSGNYQEKLFNANVSGNRFLYSQNKFYLFHETTAPGYLSEYTTKGKLEHIFKPNNLPYTGLGYSTITVMARDSFHLFSPINDTIFAFTQNQLVPKFIFDGKSHPTYLELLKKVGDRDAREKLKFMNGNRHWEIKTYLENRNFIFIVYQLGSYPFHLIIRKSEWHTTYIEEIINDLDGGIWDDPVYLSENDELYIPLSAYQITSHNIKNKKRHDFDELIKGVELRGNPVIMRCKLKL